MIKLNVGCGYDKKDDFVNIDNEPKVNPDILASSTKLPYRDNFIGYIYCRALLEHLTTEDVIKTMGEFYRVLKPGGKVDILVPHFTSSAAYSYDHTFYLSSYTLDDFVVNPSRGKPKMYHNTRMFVRNRVKIIFPKNIQFWNYLIEWIVNLNEFTMLIWEESFLRIFPAKLIQYEMVKK